MSNSPVSAPCIAQDSSACSHCGLSRPTSEGTRLHQQPSPFAAYLGTPLSQMSSTPTDTTARLKEFISEVRDEIQDMESAIQALKTQLDDGKRFLAAHEGLLCRALDLPNEILDQIFMLCLDADGCFPLFGRCGPWSLSAVCRRWRQVAIDMPKLWSGPSFSLSNETSFQKPGRMALMASRSQAELLTLDIDFKVIDETYGQLAFEELEGLFPRVQSLFLQGVPAVLDAVLHSGTPLDVSYLQSLSVTATLTGEEYLVANRAPSLAWARILSPFQNAVLDNLCLLTSCDEGYGFNQVPDILILGLDLNEVTTLCFDFDHTPYMTDILSMCPYVTSLSVLCSSEQIYQIPHNNVEMLRHLDTLLLKNMSGFMRSLDCPRLRHLTTSGQTNANALLALLSQSGCSLETLDIEILSDQEQSAFGDVARHLKTLKVLVIRTNMRKLGAILPHFTPADILPQLVSVKLRVDQGLRSALASESPEDIMERFLLARRANSPLLKKVEILFRDWGLKEEIDIDLSIVRASLLALLQEWKDARVACIHVGQIELGHPKTYQDLLL